MTCLLHHAAPGDRRLTRPFFSFFFSATGPILYHDPHGHVQHVLADTQDMGRPMARTLRAGLPRATTLYVYDVSPGAMDAFVRVCAAERIGAGGEEKEGGGGARVVPCTSCREVGERSVRRLSIQCMDGWQRVADVLSWSCVAHMHTVDWRVGGDVRDRPRGRTRPRRLP